MDVLSRIKQLLEERHWSLYKLSKTSGMAQSTLSNMFTRNNAPTIGTLEDICSALGITLSQFFASDGEPVVVDEEQKELLEKWSQLTPDQKRAFLELMK